MGLTFNLRGIFSVNGILKIIQIILAFIAIGLLRRYDLNFGNPSDRHLTGVIAVGSSLIISIPLLVAYVFFDHSNNFLEALFCVTAAAMNATGGGLAIEAYHGLSHESETVKAGLAMGSMMIINALVYLIDAANGTIHTTKA